MLVNPTDPEGYQIVRDAEAAAGELQIFVHEVSTDRDLDEAFASIVREMIDALLVAERLLERAREWIEQDRRSRACQEAANPRQTF